MRKSLALLTTGICLATTAPTFATANPFSDVPADHWSRDAVASLAQSGVLTGYGDDTFRGDRAITRYEMAQMVARAMAVQPTASNVDKTTIDKLAAEYADELKNLGVRVAALERNADHTKFSGYMYIREQHQSIKNKTTGKKTTSGVNRAWFDLISTSTVNDHWKVITETNTIVDLKNDKVDDTYDFYFASIFAQGTYGKFQTQIGRIDNFSADGGLVMHAPISGAKVSFGNKLKATLTAARYNSSSLASLNKGQALDYQAAELNYKASKATNIYANAFRLHHTSLKALRGSENPMIYTAGFRTNFAPNLRLTGYYFKASDTTAQYTKDTGYYAALEYRTVKLSQPHTWSLYAKYMNMPELTQLGMDTGHFRGYKGLELGGFYIPAKNIRAHARYYFGKDVETGDLEKKLVRGEVRIFF